MDDRSYLGGTVDLDALTNAENLSELESEGDVGYYTQETGVYEAINDGTWPEIASAMESLSGNGDGVAEINLQRGTNIYNWLATTYQTDWLDYGLHPSVWNSIIDFWSGSDPNWLAEFKLTVDASKAYGVKVVAPIWSPNGDFPDDWINTTYTPYQEIQEAALYGGGLTLDAPPTYFFIRGEAYQQFSYDEVNWANSNNLISTVIISPFGDDSIFLGRTKDYILYFERAGAIPTAWIVENYGSSDNGIGSISDSNSIASVAAWVAVNAETTTYTPIPLITTGTDGVLSNTVNVGTIISGTTVPYAQITIYVDNDGVLGKALGTGTADEDGNWNVTLTSVGYGSYDIAAVAVGLNNIASVTSSILEVTSPDIPKTNIVVSGDMNLVLGQNIMTRSLASTSTGSAENLILIKNDENDPTYLISVSNSAEKGTPEIIDNRQANENLTVLGNQGDTTVYTGNAVTNIQNGSRGNNGVLTVISADMAHNTIEAGHTTLLEAAGETAVTMGRQIDSLINTLTIQSVGTADEVTAQTYVTLVGRGNVTNIINNTSETYATIEAYGDAAVQFTGADTSIFLQQTGTATVVSEGNTVVQYNKGSSSLSFTANGGSGDIVRGGAGIMTVDFSNAASNGTETYIGQKTVGYGSLILTGGADTTDVTLVRESSAKLIAGTGTFNLVAGNSGGFSLDLSKASAATLTFESGLGNSIITGFDSSKDTATVANVSGYHVENNDLVVSLTDGYALTFSGVTSLDGMTLAETAVYLRTLIGHESDISFGLGADGTSQAQYLDLVNYGVRFGTEYSTVSNEAVAGISEVVDNRHAVANLTLYGNKGTTTVYTGGANTKLINNQDNNDGTLTVYSSNNAYNTVEAGSSTIIHTAGTTEIYMGSEETSVYNTLSLIADAGPLASTHTDVLLEGGNDVTNIIQDLDTASVSITSNEQANLDFTGSDASLTLNQAAAVNILSQGDNTIIGGSGTLSFIADTGASGDIIKAGSGAITADLSEASSVGTETYLGQIGQTASLDLTAGAGMTVISLVSESTATLLAGVGELNLTAANSGGFTLDMTKASSGNLLLESGLGSSTITGFNQVNDTATIRDVQSYAFYSSGLTVGLADGHNVTFSNITSLQGIALQFSGVS
ncbi:beta strand repeat-containing protein [Acetobacter sicerae]|uniref:beta strand repeat-containing protein n=1 Tax=Acetobacter sicerae TaxID=85325 RepID=UPI00156B8295|nr:hypothetical protein [Acetobacter sicerae]NHN93842.1 hypothetical protein [Acetobacter sicerae]